MSVAIDLRMINHSGIGSYLRALIKGFSLSEQARQWQFLLLGEENEVGALLSPSLNYRIIPFTSPVYSTGEQILYPRLPKESAVLHYPHYNIPLKYRGELIVNIHDLNHIVFSKELPSLVHQVYARLFYRQAIKRARFIITGTEFIKEQIQQFFSVNSEKIRVIPYFLPPDFDSQPAGQTVEKIKAQYLLPGQYLLTVGINKPHKNYPFLLRTLIRMWKEGKLDIPLVMLGLGHRRDKDLRKLLSNHRLNNQVIFVPQTSQSVPYQDIAYIYKGAELLIFPSIYEGFGLPLLEAMTAGTPIVAANIPAVREVAGDAVLLFSPDNEAELAEKLASVLTDEQLRHKLINRGHVRATNFPWQTSVDRTLKLYSEAV